MILSLTLVQMPATAYFSWGIGDTSLYSTSSGRVKGFTLAAPYRQTRRLNSNGRLSVQTLVGTLTPSYAFSEC